MQSKAGGDCGGCKNLPRGPAEQCGDVRQRVQKVACIKDALTNLGDECKAAAGAAVTNKK